MIQVIVIITYFTLDTIVIVYEETRNGIAPVIVFPHLEKDGLFVGIIEWTFEDDLVDLIHREYDDAVIWEIMLKCFDLRETTWSLERLFGLQLIMSSQALSLSIGDSTLLSISSCCLERSWPPSVLKLINNCEWLSRS